jgi:hypothetical protein
MRATVRELIKIRPGAARPAGTLRAVIYSFDERVERPGLARCSA